MDRTTQSLLKENRVHGDSMFPLAAYWIELPSGTHVLDTHWHEEAEFFMLLEGEILFQVDTEYFPLRAGEAVFIESGDIHAAYVLNEDTPCKFCALVFLPDLLASAQYDTIQQNAILPLQEKRQSFPRHITPAIPWQQELLHHLKQMMEAYANKMPGFETFMKGTLLIMLSKITAEGRFENRSQSDDADTTKINRLKKVILYIQDNYQEPIRTRDLSELIPMSEGQFCRFFKMMTRKTPVDYINSYRIRQAADLLQQSERKISDIAFEVGFDNVSYFIKVFRKAMKCSPSEFRKGAG
ncbi:MULTISPECIES: AraC family transcriptional regulator [Paenibacillus]|uniref:AraC family transcriptional regulator n=1 Tax=Paenibacillus odorifer TaxID=189426 RepID=A0A1R0WTK0_9BACL|nr:MULTISPECIES: AraC family transcriptional regulator [Paenibacillus]AIQ72545.1 AraC family transcriptional regulator [Paenibacillus odorifer]ETT61521.1 AraC family transcriptional regulator [Paenibacillus sp. FSL H8-237]MEC0131876.1 AraC family transcriptional regulator [Paenibacillus odorifer]MEC0224332.1 AraC family transcriptional regulator [Paenibacillus odorifer]OMC97493.1 AraC family transcriptional regulator [Paenibacillus odorifer]